MKSTVPLKRGLAQVRRHWQAGRYDRALAGVNRLLENWPNNPHLLVLWAELVQLQEDESAPPLEEAKAALQRAVELDETSPEAWVELGHFLSAVEDDARAATACFTRAIEVCKRNLQEALLGQARTLTELGRRPEALACIAEAYWLEAHNGKTVNGAANSQVMARLQELAQAE